MKMATNPGITEANALPTAGGTLSGIFITKPFFVSFTKISVAINATMIPVNNPLASRYPQNR
ncbi:hypothetical protein SDC9_204592 [bioreactor metagenome]|uniref:Uncharacterized protein n=1 Tax=bioreactor metagenome TaxID=1076179 RepID=A0A645J2G2_9ZZZZ